MAYDDEDPAPAPVQASSASSANNAGSVAGDEAPPTAEDDLQDEEVQDFRKFASAMQKTQVSSKSIRKGEKDFESHGTRLQEGYLESSRRAMHETLSFTRTHPPSGYIRGWYFPEHFKEEAGEGWSDRVVVVEQDKGGMFKATGRVMKGRGANSAPAWDRTWLLPEEALYLVERGDLHLWWPEREIGDVFPLKIEGSEDDGKSDRDHMGLPLSFQAAYALFIGRDGEHGKISLEKYQVYANLRRCGYFVFRTNSAAETLSVTQTRSGQSLWQWLFSILSPSDLPTSYPAQGPLVKPGLYRSYQPIFRQLHLISRHKPTSEINEANPPQPPFNIFYHVYKSRPGFSKASPPPPDFRIAVVNARTTSVPTITELSAMLESTPWDPPDEKTATAGQGVGFMYKRLKHGWRNAILAVVDSGFTSYLRFTEMAFGEEKLYETFDRSQGKGGKKGRGGPGGRGGKAGRGGGRGRGGKRGG
ncbi:putative tRNA-splicing endonuclease subunit sen54 N-term-domain-containing protein [Seiridium unicorne]|uniref:tRNA-splicing endonuclease subunit sen54 N-term-domain-containing protein n=1 Tax=Seiridium unicorne TaxID=138068 RepID=A0ABR2V2I8_9PEZI